MSESDNVVVKSAKPRARKVVLGEDGKPVPRVRKIAVDANGMPIVKVRKVAIPKLGRELVCKLQAALPAESGSGTSKAKTKAAGCPFRQSVKRAMKHLQKNPIISDDFQEIVLKALGIMCGDTQ